MPGWWHGRWERVAGRPNRGSGRRASVRYARHMPTPAVRKISETIVDFGAPLIEELGPDAPPEAVRAAFEFVVLVWNAHVCALPRWGQPRFLADLQRSLQACTPPDGAKVEAFRVLSQRRSEHFATDARAVGEWSVETRAGRWHLRCDARAPVTA